MKSRLIVNPVAGSDSAPSYLKKINEGLRQAFDDLDIFMTIGPGDAARAGEEAAREDCEVVFVAGGDGTLNEVLNGVARAGRDFSEIIFGVIPMGTGNDFASAIGISEDVDRAIETLVKGNVIEVDIGLLNDRHFVNVSAGGFIAEVSHAVGEGLKNVAGKLAYLIGGAQVLFEHEGIDTTIKYLTSDGFKEEKKSISIFAACNSRQVGGGRLIAPHAIIDDGLLDICLIEAMPWMDFVSLLTRISGGDHLEDEGVTYFRTSELSLSFDREIKVNTDGEVLQTRNCNYRVMQKAARFFA
jgi:diacylglycerol kinase (ATP)